MSVVEVVFWTGVVALAWAAHWFDIERERLQRMNEDRERRRTRSEVRLLAHSDDHDAWLSTISEIDELPEVKHG